MRHTGRGLGVAVPGAKYRWREWFRQAVFTLARGEDYNCSTGSMIQQVRNAASAAGVLVSIKRTINRGGIIVKVTIPRGRRNGSREDRQNGRLRPLRDGEGE